MDPESIFSDTIQIQSGVIIINKSAESEVFIDEWIRLSDPDLDLWQDSVFPEQNLTSHRQDQSIFSLLWKSHNLTINSFYWDGTRSNNLFMDFLTSSYSIQAIRNRSGASKINKHLSTNLLIVFFGQIILETYGFLKQIVFRDRAA